jgi:signal transduction histidine kinase
VRVLEAGRQERQRLERNLHDGAQQRLVALSLELSLLSDDPATDRETRDRLVRARAEVTESLRELREVARGTYPAVLSGHGLAVALESLEARAPVPLTLHTALAGRLSEPVEAAAYYVVSESLANIGKHAQAHAATVLVAEDAGVLHVEVGDDGVGGADAARGSGLRGLTDRVEALGGTLHFVSPVGGGTRLRAEIPCR